MNNFTPRNERQTQERIIQLFRDDLGYTYLGDWHRRENNRNIEQELLAKNLRKRGYTDKHISGALQKLLVAADTTGTSLYNANLKTYNCLRYPISVRTSISKPHEDVAIIDWEYPENNDFAIAEEVTLKDQGGHQRRPDIVLYINGIAIGVIELKRASVEIGDGIRQLNSNQDKVFNQSFFAGIQLTFAGNDSQGLHYGTVGTPEQFYVRWKTQDNNPQKPNDLDQALLEMCRKETLLDIIRNAIIFDAGIKIVPRPHQYMGLKAAQERIINEQTGGVIWHTQGSGKSMLMVLLAKWIMEYDSNARLLVITDRIELDKQIDGVMRNAGVIPETEKTARVNTRQEFLQAIASPSPRLICSLIHKFGTDKNNINEILVDRPPISGKFYVFVDECHRTQGGDMHKQMKSWLNDSIFIGFTGTPLLRTDKQTTREVFGTNIHTYKMDEAVADGVILDLKYEARDIPQRLVSPERIDEWFESKAKRLNDYQKAVLKKAWGNLEKLMSSKERKNQIIVSIIEDFNKIPRLNNNKGTAILVAPSIYDVCHYFDLFSQTPFGKHCGIITSFEPNHNRISREPEDSDERYKYDVYTDKVLPGYGSTTAYEDEMKRQFINEPANRKLLIVVSKLLTGFDAPSCTYIYLDNELRNHNLFQAICRTNRLDTPDKDYGYIVDYKQMLTSVQEVISVYTSDELDQEDGDTTDNNIELKDWLIEGRKQLDETLGALKYLCEPVRPPRALEDYYTYFCGRAGSASALKQTEELRINFYKLVVRLVRAFNNINSVLEKAGYTDDEIEYIGKMVDFYIDTRNAIKKFSGEELDVKPFEADMRYLINTYIGADPSNEIGNLEGIPLLDLIVKTGMHDAIAQKFNERQRASKSSVASSIINNIRKVINKEQLSDPRFYDKMSVLLDDLIEMNKESTEAYAEFLKKAEELVRKMKDEDNDDSSVPHKLIGKPGAIMVFNNLPDIVPVFTQDPAWSIDEPDNDYNSNYTHLALEIDQAMKEYAPAGWRGDDARENVVKNALFPIMERDRDSTIRLFELLKNANHY